MYVLGHSCKVTIRTRNSIVHANRARQVAYQAGLNEKLLGDFIKKHGVRDQVFG